MKQKNKYIINKADNSDLLELAQMRWDFKIEEQIELHVSRELFIEICTKWLHQNLDSNLWTFWIARKDEELIAHIFVCKIPKVPAPDNLSDAIGYITNVYVKPVYRNQGIGSSLLVKIKESAAAEKFELLFAWPSKESVSFYQRAGFALPESFLQLSI